MCVHVFVYVWTCVCVRAYAELACAAAGMQPVEVKIGATSERRMSAEDRRMARIVKTDDDQVCRKMCST